MRGGRGLESKLHITLWKVQITLVFPVDGASAAVDVFRFRLGALSAR